MLLSLGHSKRVGRLNNHLRDAKQLLEAVSRDSDGAHEAEGLTQRSGDLEHRVNGEACQMLPGRLLRAPSGHSSKKGG
jgi:hypothetical protein